MERKAISFYFQKMIIRDQERKGELLIVFEAMLYGLFPIIINYSGGKLPPIFFAGISIFIASLFFFVYLLASKKTSELLNKKGVYLSLGVALFIMIIPPICIFSGANFTSGVNTALLLQSEVIFTFLIWFIICFWDRNNCSFSLIYVLSR